VLLSNDSLPREAFSTKIEEVFFREAEEVIASEGDPAVVEGVKTRINLLALYGAAREGRSSNHTLLGWEILLPSTRTYQEGYWY
jgi:bifunctional N-acetylglucosamine-1-phosphate-uridyltransferase/glucosamine-1-phosphate-acetyltransferase GlmU-like protein